MNIADRIVVSNLAICIINILVACLMFKIWFYNVISNNMLFKIAIIDIIVWTLVFKFLGRDRK